jgi:hypothetical protein
MWELHPKGVHHKHQKIFLYQDHSPKTIKFTPWYSQQSPHFISSRIPIHIWYFYKSLFNKQHEVIECKLWTQKFQSLPLIYSKERNGWIVNHIHLHLFPMYQTNHQFPFITFHPFMDRFYIIENIGFGQVYILDETLLLAQNSYLNYS